MQEDNTNMKVCVAYSHFLFLRPFLKGLFLYYTYFYYNIYLSIYTYTHTVYMYTHTHTYSFHTSQYKLADLRRLCTPKQVFWSFWLIRPLFRLRSAGAMMGVMWGHQTSWTHNEYKGESWPDRTGATKLPGEREISMKHNLCMHTQSREKS